ncbi:MAG: LysE family translocator [Paracoccaceae bacterium]
MTPEHLSALGLSLSILAVGFAVIGPNILAVMGTSMARGRRAGAMLSLGIGLGSGLWATLTVAGLSALLAAYAGALVLLKLFGAAYLTWMAIRAFRNAASKQPPLPKGASAGDGNMFLRGILIQMSNPKAALQWIAIVSLGIGPNAPWTLGIALILSATVISIAGHMAYAFTFSTGPVVRFYTRARRWIEGALGFFFGYAAYKLATAKV